MVLASEKDDMNKEAFLRGIKRSSEELFTPKQVRYQLKQQEKRKADLNRTVAPALLGGAATRTPVLYPGVN